MTEPQNLLLSVLSAQLFKKEIDIGSFTSEEICACLEEAKQQAVFLFAYSFFKQNNYDETILEKYSNFAYTLTAKNARNLHYHNGLHIMFDQNRINYVILKGQASAAYYMNPMKRSMGDVDFLVDKTEVETVERVLVDNGFIKSANSDTHRFHWAYHKGDELIELHWNSPGVPEKDNEIIMHYLKDILKKKTLMKSSENCFYVPNAFHHGIILLLHAVSHMVGTSIGLRQLCDWLVFENKFSNEEFVKSFEQPLKEIGLWKYAQVLTKIGVLYLGCDYRKWCDEADEELCDLLLEDVFSGGNFGTKDDTRRNQDKLIQNSKTRRVKKGSTIRNLASSLDSRAKKEFSICKRIVLFRPIGWMYIIFRHFFRLATGKSHSVLNNQVFQDAMNRQTLYSKLELFEPHKTKG